MTRLVENLAFIYFAFELYLSQTIVDLESFFFFIRNGENVENHK